LENNLKRIEYGSVSPDVFMKDIEKSIFNIVNTHKETPSEYKGIFGSSVGEIVGTYPRCKKDVLEKPKVYPCSSEYGFVLFKDNKFFTSQKSKLTKTMVKQFLDTGSTHVTNFVSSKTGKKYSADVLLDDNVTGYANFKIR